MNELENEIKEFETFLNDYKLPYRKRHDAYSNTLSYEIRYNRFTVNLEKKIVNDKTRLCLTIVSDMYNLSRTFLYEKDITIIIDVNMPDKVLLINNHYNITKYDISYLQVQFVYLSLYNEKRIRLAF